MKDLWGKVKETATTAGQKVAETAVKSANVIAQKASTASQTVADTATKSAITVADAVSSVSVRVSDISKSTYDTLCELAANKIKSMIRGIDLQSAIEALQKQQEETGTDVTKLVNFIQQLKEFSEDGKE